MDTKINSAMLIPPSRVKIFLLFFFILLSICSFLIVPYDDSFYYWDWGRHLALSYFDGAPAIAYLMRVFSLIFGNTTYAINLLGVISIYLTLFFIYQTGLLIFDKSISLNACLLWILSTLVVPFLFLWVTYDNPLIVTWAMTIFFAIRYIKYTQTMDLYFIGCSTGLLLLSKYTGIILLISLIVFLLQSPSYRKIFLNKHFYFSILLAFIISSPVFIWNYQHNWISFSYQLEHRALPPSFKNIYNYLEKMLTQFNVLLCLPLYALFKSNKIYDAKQQDAILLLHIISITFILFFLYQSVTSHILRHWLTPFTISSALLCGYYFTKFQLKKFFWLTLFVYLSSDLFSLTTYTLFQKNYDGNIPAYLLAKQASKRYVQPNSIVITSFWETAAQLSFWLPGKMPVYTLPCGLENQYAFWSLNVVHKIKNKELKKVVYLDFQNKSNCIKKYFSHCEKLPVLSYQNSQHLFAYICFT